MDVKNLVINNKKLLHKLFNKNEELAFIRDEFLKFTKLKNDKKSSSIIATGHQPILYYPGIMFKNYFISKAAKEIDGIPVNFVVDTDIANISIPVPYQKNNNFYKKNVKLNSFKKYFFFDFNPSEKDMIQFYQEIEGCIQSLNNKDIRKAFLDHKNRFLDLFEKNHHFVDTVILLRKKFESLYRFEITDLRISVISKSNAFYQFVYYIIKNIENFTKIHNNAVEKSKKNTYQEVKLLSHERNTYELPFWFVNKAQRYSIYLKKEDGLLSFFTEDENLIFSTSLDNKDEEEIVNSLKNNLIFFPKAITLTLMFRIFLCDVFIHGTGGVFYDRITDDIIKDFFNLDSYPGFLSVTGNIYLPLIDENILEINRKYEEKQEWLKGIFHHPSKYMHKNHASKYIERKKGLSKMLSIEKDPQERKDIHIKLKDIDREIKNHFSSQIKRVQKELSDYENILKNKAVFFERKYPYFFYPKNVDFASQLDKGTVSQHLTF